ncbi:MAG: type-F conjugative transfer system pilin assembly protein TraF [Alphaproteobacteria bacterium]|nr:type-F conjugative transfer system pilin assembly protein TraF [Alphaproteobacteria bacterium]
MTFSIAVYQCCRNQKSIRKAFSFFCIINALIIMLYSEAVSAQQKENLNNGGRAQPSFFERKAEGWHWYQSVSDNKIEGEVKTPLQPFSPTQAIEAQRKALETKLHAAIVEPTRDNIIAYITAQKALMDQSQKFSEMWKQVVMTTPALDETLVHPVDQNARHVYYSEQHKETKKRIMRLASEYGLFFFFRKNCSYCHHFAPIVKRFAQKYGWSVLPISLDGGTLTEFPNAKQNNGIAERLQIAHVPALIAIHPKSGQLIPLAYGLTSESEIENRVEMLTRVSGGLASRGLVPQGVIPMGLDSTELIPTDLIQNGLTPGDKK